MYMRMYKGELFLSLLNNISLSSVEYLTPPFVRAVAAVSGSKAEALGAAFCISGVQMERSQFALVTARAFHIFLRESRHIIDTTDRGDSWMLYYNITVIFTYNMRGAPCINSVRW